MDGVFRRSYFNSSSPNPRPFPQKGTSGLTFLQSLAKSIGLMPLADGLILKAGLSGDFYFFFSGTCQYREGFSNYLPVQHGVDHGKLCYFHHWQNMNAKQMGF